MRPTIGPEARSPQSLSKRTLAGLIWLLMQSVIGRVVTLGSQIVLALALSPSDFGIISIVLALNTLVFTISNLGIEDLLLQRKRHFGAWVAVASRLNFAFNFIAFLASFAVSYLASKYYANAQITPLLFLAAFASLISSFQLVPQTILKRDFNFKLVALINTGEIIALQIFTIILAIVGFGAYSFVLPLPVVALLKLLVLSRLAYFSIGRTVRTRKPMVFYLLRNGMHLLSTRSIINCVSQGDYIILGLFASKSDVGAYYFSYKLAMQPLWLLAGNFSGVLIPTLIAMKDDPIRQKKAAFDTARLLSYIIFPVCFCQAALSAPVLSVLFGQKWESAVPILQIISIGIAFDAVTWVTGAYLNARQLYRATLYLTFIFATIYFPLVFSGAYFFGALGVATAVMIYFILLGPCMSHLVLGTAKSGEVIVSLFVKPVFLSILAVVPVYLFVCTFADFARIIFLIVVSPIIYVFLVNRYVPDIIDDVLSRFFIKNDVSSARILARLLTFGRPSHHQRNC